jgi:hypothetical protein
MAPSVSKALCLNAASLLAAFDFLRKLTVFIAMHVVAAMAPISLPTDAEYSTEELSWTAYSPLWVGCSR